MSGIIGAVATALAGLQAPLVLDGLIFTGSEVPSGIRVGGAQTVILHRLPGGRRLYDVIGPDEDAIEWEGLLVGPFASAKAELLAAMRRDGLVRVLSFGDLVLQVLIVRFEYCYQAQGAIIPYCLRAEIVFDPVASLLTGGSGSTMVSNVVAAGTQLSGATAALNVAAALAPTQASLGVPVLSGQLSGIITLLGGLSSAGALNVGDGLWSARSGVEGCLASSLTAPIALSDITTTGQFSTMMMGSAVSAFGTQARSSIALAQTQIAN